MGTSIEATGSNLAGLARQYRVITHNLANANTAGFKREISSMWQSDEGTSGDAAAGSITDHISVDFGQGRLVPTGRSLDLALEGSNCFFVVETPQGPLYTRNGVFRTNDTGQLVDAAGRTVAGEGGPIVIPPGVGATGISVSDAGQTSAAGQTIGKLRIVEFDEPEQLTRAGGVAFQAPEGLAPKPAGKARVHQGFQEGANVVAVQELVDLITLSRLYEANFKSIETQDDRLKSLIQVAMG